MKRPFRWTRTKRNKRHFVDGPISYFFRKGDTAECKFLFHFHNLTVLNYSFGVANVPAIYFSARLFRSGCLNYIHFVTARLSSQTAWLFKSSDGGRGDSNTGNKITVFRRWAMKMHYKIPLLTQILQWNASVLLFTKQLLLLLLNSIIFCKMHTL